MWPKGIQRGNPMPEDPFNEISVNEAIQGSGIPRIYIFPAQSKTVPYKQFAGFPSVQSMVEFVRDNGSNSNSYRWKDADFAKIDALKDEWQEKLNDIVRSEKIITQRPIAEKTRTFEEL